MPQCSGRAFWGHDMFGHDSKVTGWVKLGLHIPSLQVRLILKKKIKCV